MSETRSDRKLRVFEGIFVSLDEIFINPHLIVSKALRLVGLSNHPFTACQPSLDSMLRYQDRMPVDCFGSYRFIFGDGQAAMDTVLNLNCLKLVFAP